MMRDDVQIMADVLRVLLRAFTIDEGRFPAAEGQARYNGPDFQTVHFIAGHPGCSGLDLAAFLGVAPTTAQSVIDRLVRRDLVSRERSAEDRRAVSLALTGTGEALRTAILRQDMANCRRMLGCLPPRKRSAFVEQLEQIAQGIGEAQR